jgi:hypothetical protein
MLWMDEFPDSNLLCVKSESGCIISFLKNKIPAKLQDKHENKAGMSRLAFMLKFYRK